jgi:hypothetical protein
MDERLARMTTTAQQGRISVTRHIDAPATQIFALLVDPARHPGIDGSGMVRDGSGNQILSSVGNVFRMQMHHEEWGPYEMDNHVTEFEADRRISWEPRPVINPADVDEKVPGYYVWGYELKPIGSATIVTESFDCTRSPQWLREATNEGEGWREAMIETLDKLSDQCAQLDTL